MLRSWSFSNGFFYC